MLGWALESRLGLRIVLGCKVDKMGKGNEKKIQAPLVPPYVWPVAVDPWQLSGPGGQGGGGGESRTRTEEMSPCGYTLHSTRLSNLKVVHKQVVGHSGEGVL